MKTKIFLFILLVELFLFSEVNAMNLYSELKNNSVQDDIASTYVTASTGIDFLETSSDTNGKGLYMMGNTASDSFPILYYRGDINNNYIIYGNYCWQIIRTTSTGGIKIMYAGIPDNNTCNNTGADLAIGKSSYNDSNVAPKYGWTYVEDGVEKDSLAKSYLDEWYSNNMIDKTKELEDTIWCNDRRNINDVFDSKTRLEEGKPILSCEYEDSYTVNKNKGNGKLTYPTGIINADEVTFGGEVLKKTQTSTYINIGYSYWSMTPYVLTKNMYPNSKGMLNMYTFTYKAGIRPMVSLRNTAEFTVGDGTNNNPYRVEVEKQYKIETDLYSESNTDESEKGKDIRIIPKNRDGYVLVGINVTDTLDNDLGLDITNSNGIYSFIMPENDVKVTTNYRVVKDSYKVETTQDEVSITEMIVEEDQKASFKVIVPHGYKLLSVKALNSMLDDLNINIVESNGMYEFTMPGENVIIKAELEELPKYKLFGEDIEISKSDYYANDKVDFKVKEKTGMIINKVTLFDENDEKLNIELNNNDNNYSFNMPSQNVYVKVEYKVKPSDILENPLTSTMNIVDNIHKNYNNLFIIPISLLVIVLSIHLIKLRRI